MTPEEAHAAAAEEGLELLRAENSTGFKSVIHADSVNKPFQARPYHGGRHAARRPPLRQRLARQDRPHRRDRTSAVVRTLTTVWLCRNER